MSDPQIPERLLNLEVAVESGYCLSLPNQPIPLYEGPVELFAKGQRAANGNGLVVFSWYPTPCIQFGFCDSNRPTLMANELFSSAYLHLIKNEVCCRAVVTEAMGGKEFVWRGRVCGNQLFGSMNYASELMFHVPNFPSLGNGRIRNAEQTMFWGGRLALCDDNYEIVLDRVAQGEETIRKLRLDGGAAVTHVSRIQRKDGGRMQRSEAINLIDALRYFCSFVAGRWCTPILPFGRSAHEVAWSDWHFSSVKVTPWQDVLTWCPCHFPPKLDGLNEVFVGFMKRWNSDVWRETIRELIYWYLESNLNAGALEGSIVLAHTALDKLSWTFLHEDTAQLSKRECRKLTASGRIRKLLVSHQIPVEFSPSSRSLHREAASLSMCDGPDAISKVRNAIVHSDRGLLEKWPRGVLADSWNLALWYLEMVLLSLFQYSGIHAYRLERGAESFVPWARPNLYWEDGTPVGQ